MGRKKIKSLKSRSLSKKKLSTLPTGVFDGLTNLRGLILSKNKLSTLPGSVGILSNLNWLDLIGTSLDNKDAVKIFQGKSAVQVFLPPYKERYVTLARRPPAL